MPKYKTRLIRKITSPETPEVHRDIQRLMLLFTVVNRKKTEFYADFIQSNFEVNMQMVLAANGTASSEIMSLIGLSDSEKSVIISVIRDDMEKRVLNGLEEKFSSIKNGKGIAYTVPVSSTIGVAIYQFLANLR
ncbi:MAG: hypothetical protein IKB34_02045 [Clostridia bacterium]|nr:hypothetical protein [Clostridia bacterium]